jgi:hypothetical protein
MDFQLALALSFAQSITVPSAGGASGSNSVRLERFPKRWPAGHAAFELGAIVPRHYRMTPSPRLRCRRRASIRGERPLVRPALPPLVTAAAYLRAAAYLTSLMTNLHCQVGIGCWNNPKHEPHTNVFARGAETARAASQAIRELMRINPFTTTATDISSAMSQVVVTATH